VLNPVFFFHEDRLTDGKRLARVTGDPESRL
jgi:hypothetical protein